MSYDWTTGHCKDCGKFVRDGEGIQEQIEDGEILRFCVKCHTKRCELPAPAPADRAVAAIDAEGIGSARAAAG
jgi:hypothetical protein